MSVSFLVGEWSIHYRQNTIS